MIDVSLVLTSAVHIPERKAALDELRAKVNVSEWAAVHEETERAPNWQWSAWAWDWAADQDTLGTVFLQEDIDVCPDFAKAIDTIVRCHPNEIIGLHCAHPGARRAFLDGYRWGKTRDGLIGVGYYLPTAVTRDMVQWRLRDLRTRAYERISEDCLVDIYAMCKGLDVWHPLPSPVRHKVDMKSTYDNDNHLLRMTQVTWEDAARLELTGGAYETSGVAWLGEFYQALPHHILDLLADKEEAKALLKRVLERDKGAEKFRRFFGQVRGAT